MFSVSVISRVSGFAVQGWWQFISASFFCIMLFPNIMTLLVPNFSSQTGVRVSAGSRWTATTRAAVSTYTEGKENTESFRVFFK
jgi:hypothetical protein